MRKLVLLAHITLDGFVADTQGKIDGFDASDENLGFVFGFTKNADAALFGRKSFDLLESFWPTAMNKENATEAEIGFSNWYVNAKKTVVSKTLKNVSSKNTSIVSENILQEIIKLKEEEGKDILIFGSPSITQLLMEKHLIDSYWIFINPLIWGKGISLFNQNINITNLKLIDTRSFTNGEVALHYITEK